MSTGSTSDFNLSRNDLIDMAYRKIGISSTTTLTSRAADALNLIIREEDLKGTGQAKNLWALSESTLKLSADGFVYSTTEGLDSAILDLITVFYRNTSGDDVPVFIYDHDEYERIADKNESGEPKAIYLKRNIALASQLLYVWPTPSSVGTTSEVTGSDSLNYSCIMGHTSATDNKPITGANWRLYWRQTGSSGSAWVTATDYTNGELLRYVYKRPLYDFDASTDNPDMPQGWTRFLMWRLAHDLAPEFDIDMESRAWLKRESLEAYEEIFNSARSAVKQAFNRTLFF